MRPGCRRVQSGSLSSLGCALGAVRFILVRYAHWGTPWQLSGSSGVAVPAAVRPGSRQVHRDSLGSLECNLGEDWFIQVLWDQWDTPSVPSCPSGAPWMSSGSSVVAGFNGGALWGSSGSSGVAGLTEVHPAGRWVHQGSLHSLGCALGVVGFIRVRWVHWDTPWVPSGSSGVAILLQWDAH